MHAEHRLSLVWSKICPTLMCNVHTWSKFQGKARARVNSVFMTAWRAVSDNTRDGQKTIQDVDVQKLLHVSSVDCVVRRRRRGYFARVCRSDFMQLK